MKKLYRKGTVHPSPPIKPDGHLITLLPAAIFSLAAALSPGDREVLAYLISTSSSFAGKNPSSGGVVEKNKKRPEIRGNYKSTPPGDHPPLFHCDCFSCYTSYWVRWDSSPSRQLIHEILEAFEDSLEEKKTKKNKAGKKDRRKRGKASGNSGGGGGGVDDSAGVPSCPSRAGESSSIGSELGCDGAGSDSAAEPNGGAGGEAAEEEEKGSVRRFVSFIGEKILGVWG